MEIETISQLTGNVLAAGVMLFMLKYFMERDKEREKFMGDVIVKNTEAITDNTSAIRELKDAVQDLSPTENGHHKGRMVG